MAKPIYDPRQVGSAITTNWGDRKTDSWSWGINDMNIVIVAGPRRIAGWAQTPQHHSFEFTLLTPLDFAAAALEYAAHFMALRCRLARNGWMRRVPA